MGNITLGLWTFWCLFSGVLILSLIGASVRAIFYFFRSTYQYIGIFGIAGGIALLILAGLLSIGEIIGFFGFIALACGTIYYLFDFWFIRFPGYFRAWRKLPICTRVLSLAFPYDLVFSLLKPMMG